MKLVDYLEEGHAWTNYTLFGESIPHLLHWDWAYLWMLDRQNLPEEWSNRLEAWKRLVAMLLLGELKFERVTIPQPLLTYTQRYRVNEVVFVKAPEACNGVPIGVLSPTVLVRPLPEPNRFGITAEKLLTELPNHFSPLPGRDRRAELFQMLEHAQSVLRNSNSDFARQRLLPLIAAKLTVQAPQRGQKFQVSALPTIPVLRRADVSAWDEISFSNVELMAPQSRTTYRLHFVPKCQYGDGTLLTFADAEAPVDVLDNIQLPCRECGRISTFELSQFGIWKYADTFYVWTQLEQLGGLDQAELPPNPELSADELRFQWNPAWLRGENAKVFVRLRFPQHRVQLLPVSQIKYNSLLVPGQLDGFGGLPIRPEWLFAFEHLPDVEFSNEVLVYPNARLRGLSYAVTIGRYARAGCRIIPDLQLGMFPRPMAGDWKRYRFYWSGPTAPDYSIAVVASAKAADVERKQSGTTMEWPKILPNAVSLEAKGQAGMPPAAGATWALPDRPEAASTQPIRIGVDFGTTNTVIYAQGPDARERVIERKDFRSAAQVIAGSGEPTASFLPRITAHQDETDETLIPSALWFTPAGELNPIRWFNRAPSASHVAQHGFKWGQNAEMFRQRYLDELMFLAIPATLNKLFPTGPIKSNLRLGFAFPLAFSDSQRSEYDRVFRVLRQNVANYSSGSVEPISNINESYACIRAVGEHLHGSVFMTADLGGGSLDVALFKLESGREGEAVPKNFQVGSAKIGGEAFVSAVSSRLGADEESKGRQYWAVRDAIMSGRVASEFQGTDFGPIATKFLPVAQELLRVMLEAFRRENPEVQVKVVLVGNGWRIQEFTAATPLGSKGGRRDLEESLKRFEISTLSIYDEQLPVPPKHIIALGALKNAQPGGRNELQDFINESKMPAGRTMQLQNGGGTIQWYELVGATVRSLPPGTGPGQVDIQRDSGPSAAARWQQQLDYAMPDLSSQPSTADVREKLGISGERMEKGPLQVILERRAEDLA